MSEIDRYDGKMYGHEGIWWMVAIAAAGRGSCGNLLSSNVDRQREK